MQATGQRQNLNAQAGAAPRPQGTGAAQHPFAPQPPAALNPQQPQQQQQHEGRKLIAQGRYRAKPMDWGVRFSEAGNPMIAIEFSFAEKEEPRNLVWQGTLNDSMTGKKPPYVIAMETAITCGFDLNAHQKFVTAMAKGPAGKALNEEKEVFIEVVHETFTTAEGNVIPFAKIAWVNPIAGIKNRISEIDAVSNPVLQKVEALYGMFRARNAGAATQSAPNAPLPNLEDIPF